MKCSNFCLVRINLKTCLFCSNVRVHFPTSTGAVRKSVNFSSVFMFVQLNKCAVVCGSELQRGHSGDGGLSLLGLKIGNVDFF